MTKGNLIKALLLNGLVFPGSGYFVIGRRVRGFALCSVVTLLLMALSFHVLLLVRFVMQAQAPLIVGNLQDFLNYNFQISQQVLTAHGEILKTYLYLLLFCYGFGILDTVGLFFTNRNQGTGKVITPL
jgi:hypothetical protein